MPSNLMTFSTGHLQTNSDFISSSQTQRSTYMCDVSCRGLLVISTSTFQNWLLIPLPPPPICSSHGLSTSVNHNHNQAVFHQELQCHPSVLSFPHTVSSLSANLLTVPSKHIQKLMICYHHHCYYPEQITYLFSFLISNLRVIMDCVTYRVNVWIRVRVYVKNFAQCWANSARYILAFIISLFQTRFQGDRTSKIEAIGSFS